MLIGRRAASPFGSPTVRAGGVTFRTEGLSTSLITRPVSILGDCPKETNSDRFRATMETGERNLNVVMFTRTARRAKPGGISTVIMRPMERGKPIPVIVIQRAVCRAQSVGVTDVKAGLSKSVTWRGAAYH